MTIRDITQLAALIVNAALVLAGVLICLEPERKYSGFYWIIYRMVGTSFYISTIYFGELSHILSPYRSLTQGVLMMVWLWLHIVSDIVEKRKSNGK